MSSGETISQGLSIGEIVVDAGALKEARATERRIAGGRGSGRTEKMLRAALEHAVDNPTASVAVVVLPVIAGVIFERLEEMARGHGFKSVGCSVGPITVVSRPRETKGSDAVFVDHFTLHQMACNVFQAECVWTGVD